MVCCSSARIFVRKGSVPSGSWPAAGPSPQALKAAAKLNSVSLVSRLTLAVEPDEETEGLEDEDEEAEDGSAPAFGGALDVGAGVFASGFCAITGIAAMDKHKNAIRPRFRKIRGQYS
jgi:hypothetical protein